MRGLVEHGGETEEASVGGLVDEDFLLIFVDGGDADVTGHEDIGAAAGFADLEDALTGRKAGELDLRSEDGELFVVEELKERDMFEFFWVAGHRALPEVLLFEKR
jgi:hypothetical protein